jgi:hypothetical protein
MTSGLIYDSFSRVITHWDEGALAGNGQPRKIPVLSMRFVFMRLWEFPTANFLLRQHVL